MTITEERKVTTARHGSGACAGCQRPITHGQRILSVGDGWVHLACGRQQMAFLLKTPETPGEATLDRRFEVFHEANPQVYEQLRRLALQAAEIGRTRIGIGMLFEILRWEHMIASDDPNSEWKLNNSYRSRYSRLLMEENEELDGMFDTRTLRS